MTGALTMTLLSRLIAAVLGRPAAPVPTLDRLIYPSFKDSIVTSVDRPRIVCLCGSTRFKDAFIQANRSETLAGRIVLSVGMFGHDEGIDMDGPVKAMLDQLHFRKIDLADEVLVLNVGGYVGSSTRNEIAYATQQDKPVRFLEGPMPVA